MSQRVRINFKPVEALIFSEILAKRLNAFISLEKICDIHVIVIFESSSQKVRWSYLKTTFEKLDQDYKKKNSKQAPFAPPPDFCILDCLLPKTQSFRTSEMCSLTVH